MTPKIQFFSLNDEVHGLREFGLGGFQVTLDEDIKFQVLEGVLYRSGVLTSVGEFEYKRAGKDFVWSFVANKDADVINDYCGFLYYDTKSAEMSAAIVETLVFIEKNRAERKAGRLREFESLMSKLNMNLLRDQTDSIVWRGLPKITPDADLSKIRSTS